MLESLFFIRKISAIVLLTLMSFHIEAQISKRSQGYIIKGNIKGINTGFVKMYSSDESSISDSSALINGQFFMQGRIGLPERRRFNVMPGNWSFQAFVEDTVISLSVDTTGARRFGNNETGDGWALIWEVEQTGSRIAKVYNKFSHETNQKEYFSLLSALEKDLKASIDDEKLKAKKRKEIDSVMAVMLTSQRLWIENYINYHPGSIAGLFLFRELYGLLPERSVSYLQSMLDKFSGTTKGSIYYRELANTVAKMRSLQIDSLAPDFTLLKRDKSEFTLSSTTGKYRMIDFWASWCLPCRKAIPKWKAVYEKYKLQDFVIVSVSDDRDWDDWIQALDVERMPWIQVIDEFPFENRPAKVSTLFGIEYLPFYVLMDKRGAIVFGTNDEDLMIKKIEEVL